MAIGDAPGNKSNDRYEIGLTFQVRSEGVSSDYRNKSTGLIMRCKALLGVPRFTISHFADSEIELRSKVLEKIRIFPSYTEYMSEGNEIGGLSLADFLTERGKEIVSRLDQISIELRNLSSNTPELLDAQKVLQLLEEGRALIDSQGNLKK